MLTAYFISLIFFSGPSVDLMLMDTDRVQAAIERQVGEPARRAELVGLLLEEQKRAQKSSDVLTKAGKQMMKLNQNYEATEEQFTKRAQALDRPILESQQRGIDLRFKMRDRMTRKEWEAVWKR